MCAPAHRSPTPSALLMLPAAGPAPLAPLAAAPAAAPTAAAAAAASGGSSSLGPQLARAAAEAWQMATARRPLDCSKAHACGLAQLQGAGIPLAHQLHRRHVKEMQSRAPLAWAPQGMEGRGRERRRRMCGWNVGLVEASCASKCAEQVCRGEGGQGKGSGAAGRCAQPSTCKGEGATSSPLRTPPWKKPRPGSLLAQHAASSIAHPPAQSLSL